MLVKIPQPVPSKVIFINPDLVAAVVITSDISNGTNWTKISFLGISGEEIDSVMKSDHDGNLTQWRSEILKLLDAED